MSKVKSVEKLKVNPLNVIPVALYSLWGASGERRRFLAIEDYEFAHTALPQHLEMCESMRRTAITDFLDRVRNEETVSRLRVLAETSKKEEEG